MPEGNRRYLSGGPGVHLHEVERGSKLGGGGGRCRAVAERGGKGARGVYVQFSGDGGQVKRAYFFYILTRGKKRVKWWTYL